MQELRFPTSHSIIGCLLGTAVGDAIGLPWLRFWLLGLPAGIGYATLRAILKLWLGFLPERSGIFSAGNALAMRSAIIGVCYGDDPQKLRELVRASTRLTHTDAKAEFGALTPQLPHTYPAANQIFLPKTTITLSKTLGLRSR